MQFDNMDFVLDSKTTTIAFHNSWVVATKFGNITSASRNIFASYLTNFRMKFNRRQINVVDHILAGAATVIS